MANLLLGVRKLLILTYVARRDRSIQEFFEHSLRGKRVLEPTKVADTNTRSAERLVFYFKIPQYDLSASTTLSVANVIF